MSSLQLKNINKVYPSGEVALHNVNFSNEDKEFIVILGGEKSGKSTLLRIIAGLEDPSGGSVLIDGKDVTAVAPKDRDIAMVFKGDSLYPAKTVFENMAFGLQLRNAPHALISQRVKVAAEILRLNDLLNKKPKALTSEQKQRVAIARAIVREPRLYLFDEPLSGLDDKLSGKVLDLIVNLQARMEGAFVYATKNLGEALTVGTRIVLLKEGLIQQIDTPANMYDYPANTYVAFYIGSPTINFFNGARIVCENGTYYGVYGDIKLEIPENIKARFENIEDYAASGKKVILGIRPEDAKISDGGIEAKVEKTVADGNNYFAECTAEGGIPLTVSAQKETEAGKNVKVSFDLKRLYIFDDTTRLTLLKRDGGYKNTGYADAGFTPLEYDEERRIVEKIKPAKDKKKK